MVNHELQNMWKGISHRSIVALFSFRDLGQNTKNVSRVPNFEKTFKTGTSRTQSRSLPTIQRGYVRVTVYMNRSHSQE